MFWLLVLVVAILLFGAAAVRGFLGMVGFWILGGLLIILVFSTFKYLLPEADVFDFSMLVLGILGVLSIARVILGEMEGEKAEENQRRIAQRKRAADELALERQKESSKLNPKLRPRKSLEESYKRKKN